MVSVEAEKLSHTMNVLHFHKSLFDWLSTISERPVVGHLFFFKDLLRISKIY